MNMIQAMAHQLGTVSPISGLTIGMIRADGNCPKLKLKAAETRYMVPIVLKILESNVPLDTDHLRLRYNCFKFLARVYEMINDWDANSPPIFADAVTRHLLLYVELNQQHNPDNQGAFWRLYPKHHLFAHFAGVEENPRNHWLYHMESQIGDAAKIARGVNVRWMHTAFIQRYHDTFQE